MIRGKLNQESLARVRTALRRRPGALYQPLRREFENWGIDWRRGVIARFTGSTGPESLRSRSGTLARSLTSRVSGSSILDLNLRLATEGVIYARLQEYGGEVRPVRAQYLTIPIGSNVLPSGLSRYPTAARLAASFPGRTAFLRSSRGALLLGVKDRAPGKQFGTGGTAAGRDKKGSFAPYFVLKKGVRVPARLGFFETWRRLAPRRSEGLVRAARAARGG